ncbi:MULTISPECIES: HD domain-containing protein [Dellaglioa]|uniref:HD superfamily hydrolase n=3 Tax=Dellaglioa TaxID=2767880 RepID=A0A0R1HJ32_9LACO|nr:MULTISPECIES: HD domain-containing protein [Dellaglioa]KRK46454.1 HD superfamily hydrolase [Dellaglioa algida DSM 15638]MCZ2491086.1 HD domain-containing protein [Dellaglioa carnosa]MCZ2492732.1 HD domain-containing protein [Dellaglioa carnosa]MCZ2494164.1 HD domain-containing protein [Dellaglioa carnosa]MDK1716716.1 HD domain-containing protein [Dellaglioa algida]
MKKDSYLDDELYMSYVGDLLAKPEVQRLSEYTQHHFSTRLEHSISVSYDSYRIAKKLHLNAKATARAGLLHDLFYYDWRTTKFDRGTHAWIHPRIAVRNAEKLTTLSDLEKDIIIKHMWGATIAPPKYPEGYIVTMVDKYEATSEVSSPVKNKSKRGFQQLIAILK